METTATTTKDILQPSERALSIAEKHRANGYIQPTFEELVDALAGVRASIDAVGSVGTLLIMAEFFDVLAETHQSETLKSTVSILHDAAEKLVEMLGSRSAERYQQN